jgi:hypothetical protein
MKTVGRVKDDTFIKKAYKNGVPMTPLILFAASPGTITGVITLSVSHADTGLPVTALVGVVFALAVTWLVMVFIARSAGSPENAQSGGKAPTLVLSTVISRIFHGAVLQARLPFQLMAVKKHVQAAVDFVVLIAAAFYNFVLITPQAHTVVIDTFQIGVAEHQLDVRRNIV